MDIIKDRRTSLSFLYLATNPEIHYIDDRYSARGVSALMHGNWRGGRNEIHNTSSHQDRASRRTHRRRLRLEGFALGLRLVASLGKISDTNCATTTIADIKGQHITRKHVLLAAPSNHSTRESPALAGVFPAKA